MATQTLPSRTYILHLYRSLLRASQKFSSYNFKDYAYRKTKDSFRENKNETNSERIIHLVQKAEQELGLLRRQGYLNSLYAVDRLVVEDELKGNQKTRLRGDN